MFGKRRASALIRSIEDLASNKEFSGIKIFYMPNCIFYELYKGKEYAKRDLIVYGSSEYLSTFFGTIKKIAEITAEHFNRLGIECVLKKTGCYIHPCV